YAVPNLKAGTYHFHCEIHPNLMNGTFNVAAAPTATTDAKPSTTPSPTMSMGADTPHAAPAETPKPDKAPRAAVSATTPAGTAGGSSPAASPASTGAAGDNLPRTGPGASRLLLLLSGLALASGGLSLLGGARRQAG
ncbi:MAG TPA: LPXTG cell wall anchor domain-containing protein, partial [Acidimicrobiia bacterium]|nr:LPXTG cell wall anchor domain-containing protein [Acidimicrobiia bacterium]